MLVQIGFLFPFTFNFGLDLTRIVKNNWVLKFEAQLKIVYAYSQYRCDLKFCFYQYDYV